MSDPPEAAAVPGTATTTYFMAGNDMLGVKPPTFDWEATDLTKQFKSFRRYCGLLLSTPTYATKSPAEVVNYILLWMGPQALDIYDNMKFDPETDKDDPEKVWQSFLSYFEPKSNYRLARFQLRDIVQANNESVDSFVMRLKVQAQKCNFSDAAQHDDHIVDQIIKGTAHESVRRKLLNQDPTKLTLDSVMDFARTYEATCSQMQLFNASGRTTTNVGEIRGKRGSGSRYHRHKRTGSRHYQDSCGYCGGQPHPRDKCPAREEQCNRCKKIGHWGKVCLSSTKDGSTDAPRGRSRGRSRGRGQRRPYRGRGSYSNTRGRGAVHEMNMEQPTSMDNSTLDESFEALTFNAVNNSRQRTEAYATVTVNYRKRTANLRGKADTGAQGNILPLRTYRTMFPDRLTRNGLPNNTEPSNVILTAYNGTHIPQYGTTTLQCRYRNGTEANTKFYVAATPGPVIFGLQTCIELGLVTMNCEIKTESKNSEIIRSAEQLKERYPDCFRGLGHFPGKQKLTLQSDSKPVIHAPRRAPIQLHDAIKKELNRMITLGVLRPVNQPTDWVSSITYVHKPDGSLRICLDPKDLNKCLKRAQQHVPTMEELAHRFSKAKVFSKLDAKSGYWAIELEEESQLLTTFNSPFGRFCFRRLPFGLKVSGDVFNAAMQKILDGLNGVISIHDDVTVFGEGDTIEEATLDHDNNLRKLMERARENHVVFNFEKTTILKPEIVFFGNIYGHDGVRPDPTKVQAITDLKPPTNVKELQGFLGMCTYLAPYISNLSEKTAHLRILLKQENEFQWNSEQDRAFCDIKQDICNAGKLAYFDPNKSTVIKVDASQQALGAALTQDGKPIAYASKSLTETESRYANIERELLACVFGAERFHTYLYGKKFLIESDHKPLEMISKKNIAAAPARLQRMLLRLQRYDYDISYVPGKEMTLADSLSRLPKDKKDAEINLDVKVCYVQFSTPKLRELCTETEKDTELSMLKRQIVNGFPDTRREIPSEIRSYWSFRDQLSVDNGLVVKGEQIVIPTSLRAQYLDRIHEAHQGINRCQQRARNSVYWPGINSDIDNIVKKCLICQTYQKSQAKETLLPLLPDMPNVPWHTLGSDMFEVDGKWYIVISDYHSKFPIVEQMTSLTSRATAAFARKIFSLFGIPNTIISDNGGAYIGAEFKEMIEELGIVHITSSPKHAKSHGFIESCVQTAQSLIRKSPNATNKALLAHRTTPLGPGMPSPAELLFNRRISCNLPIQTRGFADDSYREKKTQNEDRVADYYNQHARDLPELKLQQPVFYQDVAKRTWNPAIIVGYGPEPRSYTLECAQTGRTLRRNRQLIRPRVATVTPQNMHMFCEPENNLQSPMVTGPADATPMTPNADKLPADKPKIPTQLEVPATPSRDVKSSNQGTPTGPRLSKRIRKTPSKMKDYVTF